MVAKIAGFSEFTENNPGKPITAGSVQIYEDKEGLRIANSILRDWLLIHESDIAYGINDFDDLRTVFRAYIGRKAQK